MCSTRKVKTYHQITTTKPNITQLLSIRDWYNTYFGSLNSKIWCEYVTFGKCEYIQAKEEGYGLWLVNWRAFNRTNWLGVSGEKVTLQEGIQNFHLNVRMKNGASILGWGVFGGLNTSYVIYTGHVF